MARAVAAIVSAAAGGLWLMCLYTVARAMFSTDPAADPHGYGLVFGTVLAIVAGVVFAVVLPLAFAAERRRRVARVTMVSYAMVMALLFAALFAA